MLYQIDHPLLLQILRIEDRAEHAAAHACSRLLLWNQPGRMMAKQKKKGAEIPVISVECFGL